MYKVQSHKAFNYITYLDGKTMKKSELKGLIKSSIVVHPGGREGQRGRSVPAAAAGGGWGEDGEARWEELGLHSHASSEEG